MINFVKSVFKIVKLIIFVIFIALIITLCVNNSQSIALSLSPFPYQIETRLFLLIILFFLIGFVVGLLVNSISLMRSKISNSMNQKKLKKLKNTINEGQTDRGFV